MPPPTAESSPLFLNRYIVFGPDPTHPDRVESRSYVACHGAYPDFDTLFDALIELGSSAQPFPDGHYLYIENRPGSATA